MEKVRYSRLASGGESWTSPRGVLHVQHLTPSLYVTGVQGVFERCLVPYFKAPVDRALLLGMRPVIFNDWWDLADYEHESRVDLANWTMTIRNKLGGSHVLLRSRLVALGVAAANLAVGGFIQVYQDRAQFEATLQAALRQNRQRIG